MAERPRILVLDLLETFARERDMDVRLERNHDRERWACALMVNRVGPTFRGDGHGVVTSFDPCALSAFVAYVERGTLPPPGAFCTQHVPFARTSPTLTLEKEERFR